MNIRDCFQEINQLTPMTFDLDPLTTVQAAIQKIQADKLIGRIIKIATKIPENNRYYFVEALRETALSLDDRIKIASKKSVLGHQEEYIEQTLILHFISLSIGTVSGLKDVDKIPMELIPRIMELMMISKDKSLLKLISEIPDEALGVLNSRSQTLLHILLKDIYTLGFTGDDKRKLEKAVDQIIKKMPQEAFSYQDYSLQTILQVAIENPEWHGFVEQIINKRPEALNLRIQSGQSLLYVALVYSFWTVAEVLIAKMPREVFLAFKDIDYPGLLRYLKRECHTRDDKRNLEVIVRKLKYRFENPLYYL
ncbi:MAG: hypothetical protein K1060chlam1_00133 [Candidatus Anoxychlamydiales bacterium]|nr:hypothetical protein [Candidatus Anoxychlamydiales bacterium]